MVLAEVSPYRWDRDTVALVLLSDVTRMRRLERIRRDFVANVSRELRTPITVASGFSETLLDNSMYASEDARHFLEIAQRQIARMDAIISDLLVLTKLEAKEEEGNIHFHDGGGGTGRRECGGGVSDRGRYPWGVCERLLRSSANLQDERAAGGVSSSSTSSTVQSSAVRGGQPVHATVSEEEEMVRIAVQDTGARIPQEPQDRIFERFYRIDRASSGE